MPRVFAIEPTTKNLEAAREFGDILYLFPDEVTRPSIWESREFMDAASRKLEEHSFSCDDFFLAAGGSVPLLLMMRMLSMNYSSFKVLFYQANIQEYVLRTFTERDCDEARIQGSVSEDA